MPIPPRAFVELKIPGSPSLSPDGRRVVFEVSEPDFEESRYVSRLWLADTAPDGAKPRQITFSYEGEHSPQWSPDGRHIAFLSERPDMTEPPPEDEEDEHKDQVWVMPADGGEARRLTNTKEGVRAFEWRADGQAVIYLCDEPRPQPLQFVHDDRRKRKVDPVIEHDQKLRRQFWEVRLDDPKPDLLYSGDFGIHDFDVSPDGKRIAFTSNTTGDPNDYHLYDLFVVEVEAEELEAESALTPPAPLPQQQGRGEAEAEGPEQPEQSEPPEQEPRRIAERPGAKFAPQWSPDGTLVAFLSTLEPGLSYSQECLWTVPAEGGEPTRLAPDAPWDIHDIHWPRTLDSSAGIYARVADRTNVPLVRFSPDPTAPPDSATPADAVVSCTDFDVARDAGTVVAVLEDDRTLPELYVLDPGGERRALTELNKGFAERFPLPRQEVIRWQTDIGVVEGILIYPVVANDGRASESVNEWTGEGVNGAAHSPIHSSTHSLNPQPSTLNPQPPLIVHVHGGPKGHATNTLRSYLMHAVWASEGYLVLRPNFRGSEGYGNAFAVANRRDLGGGDFRDIMAGVDYVLERGLADPARMGIMGGSYGGYMTNWAIGHTDRFAAAISLFGIFSLVTDYSNSSLSRWDPDYMGAFYWEDPEIYRQCSPATYLEHIRTPTLILHGESDDNTFISNSKEMYQALRARGVPCQFVHYPREGHGLHEPNHRLDEMRRCLEWLDRYLKHAGGAPAVYRIEDRVKHQGYELHVVRLEEGEYVGWREEDGRLLEVAFSLASDEPVEGGWAFTLEDAVLTVAGGDECTLRGVPAGIGGGKFLVEGENLTVHVQPDEQTGRLGVGLALAYEIPEKGGAFELRVADFPPVAFEVGPKEKEEGGGETDVETSTA